MASKFSFGKRLRVNGHEYRKTDYGAALRWGCSCENRFVSKRWHPSFKCVFTGRYNKYKKCVCFALLTPALSCGGRSRQFIMYMYSHVARSPQILVVFKNPEQGFLGSLPLDQTLLPTAYTGTGIDLQELELFGGFSTAKAVLPWVQPDKRALLSVAPAQGIAVYWALINVGGKPYTSAIKVSAEYYIRE